MAKGASGSHPVVFSQTKSGGTALSPTQKSATASETTNALVLVRSRRRLQTRKMINPFPAMITVERDQPRIQNQVSIREFFSDVTQVKIQKITFDKKLMEDPPW